MVRNSVLLIDFIEIRLNEGIPMKQAIIEAGAVRTTPILLTTGAVVIGAVIILFDPIFQGLAISLVLSNRFYFVDADCHSVDLLHDRKEKWEKIHADEKTEYGEISSEDNL